MDAITAIIIPLCVIAYSTNVEACRSFCFSREENSRLKCGIFRSLAANTMDCHEQCSATFKCFSLNTYQSDNGTQTCELIKGSKASFGEDCFEMKKHSEYSELQDMEHCSSSAQHDIKRTRKALPDGWFQLGSNAFKYFPNKKSWQDAISNCSAHGASLTTIKSDEENRFISEVFLSDILDDFLSKRKNSLKKLSPMKHWELNGADEDVKLYGNASYKHDQFSESAVLDLPGTTGSYATTPSFNLNSSFTIAIWVKLETNYRYSRPIYSYWRNLEEIFDFYLLRYRGPCLVLSNDEKKVFIFVWGRRIPRNEWTHLVGTWSNATDCSAIFKDGVKVGEDKSFLKNNNFANPNEAVFDVGYDRQRPLYTKGMFRDIVAFNVSLDEEQIKMLKDSTDFKKAGAWIDQSASPRYTNWAPEYESSKSNCTTARAWHPFLWDKIDCNIEMGFICKKPA